MQPEMTKFGEFIKAKRMSREMSLREFCREHNLDPSYWSKLERGKFSAPASIEKLAEVARIVGVNADEMQRFHDLASLSRGEYPADILSDEELLLHVPAFIRSKTMTRERLMALLEDLRKEI